MKRFYVEESKLIDGYCVFDREKKYVFSPRPRRADCLNDAHILNKLYEKNKELKQQVGELEFILKIIEAYDRNEREEILLKRWLND